jgi:hypothetical protein
MTDTITTLDLWEEGQSISLSLIRTSPTSASITWTLPQSPKAYNGAVIVVSDKLLNHSNVPTDGIKYTPSQDLANPIDEINGAQVVSAFYRTFQDDISKTSTVITNLDPDKIYYASIHICSNILTYFPGGVKSYPINADRLSNNVDDYTGSIPESTEPPLNPTVGEVYYNPHTNIVQMWTGANWIQTSTSTVVTGTEFPANPKAGDYFYHLYTKVLYVFNTTSWSVANTSQVGTPTYDKTPIGRTGDDEAKARFVNMLKLELGYPAVCVELSEEQFLHAIDYALAQLRRYVDSAYAHKYLLFKLKAGQQTYYLNDPTLGTDKIVDIIKISRLSLFGVNAISGDSSIFLQTFFSQFYSAGLVDILSIYTVQSLGEEFQKIFAGDLEVHFSEMTRQLQILRKLYKDEIVILEVAMEKTEEEILTDRWTKNWVLDYAHAKCLESLGNIRNKYQSLPGPNGISMNGAELSQKASEMYTELLRQVNDYEVGNLQFGMSGILVG